MGYGTPDAYNQPEAFGLTLIGTVSWSLEAWQFDYTAVWEKGGHYYMASDSGCSCPTPFERFTSIEMLNGPFTKAEVMQELADLQDFSADKEYSAAKVALVLERMLS